MLWIFLLEVIIHYFWQNMLGSTSTAKTPPYPYRVPRGYGYYRGTAACVPPAYLFSAKKKNFRYGSGQFRYGAKPKRRRLGWKLKFLSHSTRFSSSLQTDSLSSALCLSLPPPPVSLVLSPLLSVSHFLHRRWARFSLLCSLSLTSSTAGKLGSLFLTSSLDSILITSSQTEASGFFLFFFSCFVMGNNIYIYIYIYIYYCHVCMCKDWKSLEWPIK
jgi:hypothetical protein